MTEWEPATEAEVAMRDALRANDQELYFRILARTELLLPVSAETLSGSAPMAWGTWTTGGRTHVLAFTSGPALQACLAGNAGPVRRAAYHQLAASWPNADWWLAVNPGLPIEGYLPAWFVTQLAASTTRMTNGPAAAPVPPQPVPAGLDNAGRGGANAALPHPGLPAEPQPAGAYAPPPFAAQAFPQPAAPPFAAPAAPVPPAAPPLAQPPLARPPAAAPLGSPGRPPLPVRRPAGQPTAPPFGDPVGHPAAPRTPDPGATRPGLPPMPGPGAPSMPGPGTPPTISGALAEGGTMPLPVRRPGASPLSSGPPGFTSPAPAGLPTSPAAPAGGGSSMFQPRRPVPGRPGYDPDEAYEQPAAPPSWHGGPAEDVAGGHANGGYATDGGNGGYPANGGGYPGGPDPRAARAPGAAPLAPAPFAPAPFAPTPGPAPLSPMAPTRSLAETTRITTITPPGAPAEAGPPSWAGTSTIVVPAVSTGTTAGAPVSPAPVSPAQPDFVPANDVERSLLSAAGDGSTDSFLSTLLLARVLLPASARSAAGTQPGDEGFDWRTESLDGETYVVVFTSPERLADHLPGAVETIGVKFVQLIRKWPDVNWSFAVNPGTPVGAKLPGAQIIALANWAAEVGLGDEGEPGESGEPTEREEPAARSTYAPVRQDPSSPTVMQKVLTPSQVPYYLERGYDRVSGFVHRANEVAHLNTPAQLYAALGLGHPGSPFSPSDTEVYVLRWPAHRPSLYRIPYGGPNEAAMRAMEGWVIERPPFRGNGFAPGESADVIAEFKVDSVRLPYGAELWRLGADGTERLAARLDTDVYRWRRVGGD